MPIYHLHFWKDSCSLASTVPVYSVNINQSINQPGSDKVDPKVCPIPEEVDQMLRAHEYSMGVSAAA